MGLRCQSRRLGVVRRLTMPYVAMMALPSSVSQCGRPASWVGGSALLLTSRRIPVTTRSLDQRRAQRDAASPKWVTG